MDEVLEEEGSGKGDAVDGVGLGGELHDDVQLLQLGLNDGGESENVGSVPLGQRDDGGLI